MIRGAIFDLDGTLLDSMFIWQGLGERYLRSLGIQPEENLAETFRTFTLEQAARYEKEHYGLSLTVEEIMEGSNRMIENLYFHEVSLRPGVTAFLEKLRSRAVPMVIATATDRYLAEAALRRCGILSYFSAVFTCGELGCSKEEGRIFRAAQEFLGTAQEDTWVFEDACHAAQAAARAGFPVAGIYDPSEDNQHGLREASRVMLMSFTEDEPFWKTAL